MSLEVKLLSKKKLLASAVLEVLDTEDYEANGISKEVGEILCTDTVEYNDSFDRAKVILVEFIAEDEVFKLSNNKYISALWIAGTFRKQERQELLLINNKCYDFALNEKEVAICLDCGDSSVALIEDSCLCSSCFTRKYTKINSYNYKPDPIFIGEQLKTDKDTPVWYGIELEHSCKDTFVAAKYKYKYSKDDSVFYFKHDGSIYSSELPVEMVTHPHSFSALMGAPWLNDLKAINAINNKEVYNKNGCHIHVSSTAFSDDKHYAKWYFFIYSLANGILQKIANRECTSYCQNIKVGSLLTKSKEPTGANVRTVIINERNDKTKEVRMFSTTTNPKVLKSYIQLLESTIKYSKYANTKLSYDSWVAYVSKYSTKYSELMEVLSGITLPKPKELLVPTKEIEVLNVYDVPTKFLSNIILIEDNSGNEYKISLCTVDFNNERIWVNGRGEALSFSSVKRIVYVK